MLLEILANFKQATPFKEIVLDDKWDQVNRCYMFLLCVIFGTVGKYQRTGNGDLVIYRRAINTRLMHVALSRTEH